MSSRGNKYFPFVHASFKSKILDDQEHIHCQLVAKINEIGNE